MRHYMITATDVFEWTTSKRIQQILPWTKCGYISNWDLHSSGFLHSVEW
jgi:hypothetical protein